MQEAKEQGRRPVVLEIHFEAEHNTHPFAPEDTWAAVHAWACERFHVASDACPNLELHDGSLTGGVLNEDLPIGNAEHKRLVWLVKPGPEQYGHGVSG